MKAITVFECDYCKKLYRSKSGILKHEKRCFHNPVTKSCISCQFLGSAGKCNGKILTEFEEQILNFKVDGTYHVVNGNMECNYNELNEEYKYLYDAEQVTFCQSMKIELNKLRTNCNFHQQNNGG